MLRLLLQDGLRSRAAVVVGEPQQCLRDDVHQHHREVGDDHLFIRKHVLCLLQGPSKFENGKH